MTKGSFSQFLIASTLFALRCCLGSRRMASDQRIPLDGHSWSAWARRVEASFFPPSRETSSRMVSSQSSGHFGFLRRPFSKRERALLACPASLSNLTAASHRGMLWGHLAHPSVYASRALSISPAARCAWIDIIQSLSNAGYFASPSCSSLRWASVSPASLSSTALCIQILSVPACALAFSSSVLALCVSLFSFSSLTAASQISSLSGLILKASPRMVRAPARSPEIHFSLAPISQRGQALGHMVVAFLSSASSASGVPCFFSSCAAAIQIFFLVLRICRRHA
mmetsp:Transcript_33064/g.84782  ORF Transcript_33064/g.84782 Transcript_33064/m.84782 type:complete len:283 (-) Transcript_33064:1463-2311(-)